MTQTEDAPKPTPKAPDGGWGWVVVACAFFNAVFLVGIPVTFGVVFSEKLTIMGVSSTSMTWMYNLFNFNFYITSAFAGPLSDVFSWRSVGFGSASIVSIAYALMVFASSPGIIFLLFSVVVGCSTGLASFMGFLTIPHYFDLHRGRAGAIIMTGVSTGQIIVPLLIRYLQDEYGFYGACLLFAGFLLNCAVSNLFLYPVRKRPLLKGDLMYEAAERQQRARLSLKDKLESSNCSRNSNKKVPGSSQTLRGKMKELPRIIWLHACKLQHMTLLITTLSFSVLVAGYGNFTALFPFAMAVQGHSAATTSYSLSIGALANTAVRIFVIWASDADWFSRKICYIFGAVLSGASILATVFVLHDSRFIIACQIIWGLGIGANLSVFHNLLIDTCGRELYGAGVAVGSLLMAVCNIVLGPLIGVARDYTSYEVSIGLTAALHLMCAALWVFMPLARRHDIKKFRNQEVTDKKLEEKPNEASALVNFNRKREKASYVNNGFVADSAKTSAGKHSVR